MGRPDAPAPAEPPGAGPEGSGRSRSRPLRVGLVLEPCGPRDPYDALVLHGLERAVRELGIDARALTPAPREGAGAALDLLARRGHDMVVATGWLGAAAVRAIAPRHPATRFAMIDVPPAGAGTPVNACGIAFAVTDAAYLAGVLAARMAALAGDGPAVSVVAGVRIPSVDRLVAGFLAGARAAVPGIGMLRGYTEDFYDRAKAHAVACDQIARGSRVVFQVAGAAGVGAIDAARDRGAWAVGVDVDQAALGTHVLTSAVKHLDLGLLETIRALCDERLGLGAVRLFTLADGGVGLGAISGAVPAEVLAEVERVRGRLAAVGPLPEPALS